MLALAASGNPHEAALALRRARKLMDVHGITHSDIAMSDIDETISHYWPTGSLRPPRYMLGLMNIIREAFGVNSIIHPGTYPGVGFYGNRERAALAAYTGSAGPSAEKGASAVYQCTEQKNKTATRTSRGDQFAEGWVLAVISEIQSFALTDDERELMQQWLEHKYPQTQTTGRVNREEVAMATPRAMRGFEKGRTSDCTDRSVGGNSRNWRPDDYVIR